MIALTIVGEKYKDEKGEYYLEEKLLPLPSKIKEKHHLAMLNFYKLVNYLLNKKRELPVMVTEIEQMVKELKITKPIIRDLENFGLIKTVTAPLFEKGNKHNMGNRVFIYWTPQGRAYVKEYIKHEPDRQTSGDSGTTEDSGSIQQSVSTVDGDNRMHGELPVEVQPKTDGDTGHRPDSIQESSTGV